MSKITDNELNKFLKMINNSWIFAVEPTPEQIGRLQELVDEMCDEIQKENYIHEE